MFVKVRSENVKLLIITRLGVAEFTPLAPLPSTFSCTLSFSIACLKISPLPSSPFNSATIFLLGKGQDFPYIPRQAASVPGG